MKSLVLLTMRILAIFFFPALLAWAVYHDKIIIDYILIVCTTVILSLFLLNDKINNILERVSNISKEGVAFQNNSNVSNSHNEKSLKEIEDTSKEILNKLSDSKNILKIEKKFLQIYIHLNFSQLEFLEYCLKKEGGYKLIEVENYYKEKKKLFSEFYSSQLTNLASFLDVLESNNLIIQNGLSATDKTIPITKRGKIFMNYINNFVKYKFNKSVCYT